MESLVDYISENIVNRFVNNIVKNINKKINKIIAQNIFLLAIVILANLMLYDIAKFYITFFDMFINTTISLFVILLINIIFYLVLKRGD